MGQIDSTTIFLLIIFILPGYFALKVFGYFFERDKGSDLEITYQSLTCSLIIYGLFYAIVIEEGQSLTKYVEAHPWATIFIVAGMGLGLGFIIYVVNITPFWLSKIPDVNNKLESFKLVEPPNIYSAIFNPKFHNNQGYWIVWRKGGQIWEGLVSLMQEKESHTILYIKQIREINEENEVLKSYPNDYGVLVSVNDMDGFEIYR